MHGSPPAVQLLFPLEEPLEPLELPDADDPASMATPEELPLEPLLPLLPPLLLLPLLLVLPPLPLPLPPPLLLLLPLVASAVPSSPPSPLAPVPCPEPLDPQASMTPAVRHTSATTDHPLRWVIPSSYDPLRACPYRHQIELRDRRADCGCADRRLFPGCARCVRRDSERE
jgi:hypothetical protein